ncbi:MAG: CBS domain-containing protein [Pseudomonadota bacterium]
MARESRGVTCVSLTVCDVMRTNVVTTVPEATLSTVVAQMQRHDLGCLPVLEDNAPVGMVTDRDVLVRGLARDADLTRCRVGDVMSAGPLSIRRDRSVNEARQLMIVAGVTRLFVVGRTGHLAGLVSWHDVVEGRRPRPISRQVTFYRRRLDSNGRPHDVETCRVYVSPSVADDDIEPFAVARFETINGHRPWRSMADGYEVSRV